MMQLNQREPLIFELSKPGRGAVTQFPPPVAGTARVPAQFAPCSSRRRCRKFRSCRRCAISRACRR